MSAPPIPGVSSPPPRLHGANRLRNFWQRVSEGRQIDDLWSQFAADARSSYGFYDREVDWDEIHKLPRWRRPLHVATGATCPGPYREPSGTPPRCGGVGPDLCRNDPAINTVLDRCVRILSAVTASGFDRHPFAAAQRAFRSEVPPYLQETLSPCGVLSDSQHNARFHGGPRGPNRSRLRPFA